MLRRTLMAAALAVLALPAGAVTIGDDGLHKPAWLQDTFKDLREDLASANAVHAQYATNGTVVPGQTVPQWIVNWAKDIINN